MPNSCKFHIGFEEVSTKGSMYTMQQNLKNVHRKKINGQRMTENACNWTKSYRK